MAKQRDLQVIFRIYFFAGKEKLLGKGRVELLERIKRSGSISKAAKEMNMSYRQAWQMVKEMNERAGVPYVEKQLGGKSGGGAKLTAAGTEAINAFHALEKEVTKFIHSKTKKIRL